MYNLRADFVFHPPCGSSVPGMVESNPYLSYPPKELYSLVKVEKDKDKLEKIKSALRQFERLYVYPGYPWRVARVLRRVANRMLKISEYSYPSINLNYYQDSEVPQGFEEIIDSLQGIHDNYDYIRFDYNRQGERPDVDSLTGDFISPSESPLGWGAIPGGFGPDPEMEVPFPPTGGDIDRL